MSRITIAFVVFAAIAGFFVVAEHRAHVVPFLPWVLVLACPVMHIFMHRGHRRHDAQPDSGTRGDLRAHGERS